jgi:tetratricopeptide (TPR) repeat protein
VSAEQGLTPLVGRRRELEFLLDGFERAKAGKGQAFTIISEAGLGKSRLLYEFRKEVANEEITFLEGRCISYGRTLAYHPIIAILRSFFNIQEGEEDLLVKGKVQKGLENMGVEVGATLPFLLEFLSVQDSGLAPLQMSPEAKRDKMIEALKRIILKGAEIQPLVIALEDLHWLDQSSEEALKTILESLSGSRILAIFTGRPEFVPPWSGKTYHSQLTLQRLSNRESLQMASYLLGAANMEKSLEELLLEKTEGIPFFQEEFFKSLWDLKLIENRGSVYGLSRGVIEMSVPTTIQEVILARVDSLPPEAKEVLQTGSVIEREFDFQIIRQVMNLPEAELISWLNRLKDSELLYERGIAPESTLIFRHALTREVVYDSILTDRKKELHEAVGQALETLYKDHLGEYCGLLSEHFIKSENYQKGADYSRLAGQRAEKTAAMNNAIGYALKRLSCLEKLPRSLEIEEKANDLRAIIGVFMIDMNYFKRAQEIITPIIGVDFKGDKKRISQLLTIIGTLEFTVEEDLTSAFSHLEEALMLSQKSGDLRTLAMVSYWMGCAQAFNCEFDKARTNIERSEKIQRKAKAPWREATLKSLLSHLVYYYQGRLDLAFKISNEAVRIAEESGDIYSKTFAYCCHGISCFGLGLFKVALDFLLQGRDFSERLDQYWWHPWSNHFLGEIYYETQRYPEAVEAYHKAASLFEHYGNWPSSAFVSKIGLERAKTKDKGEPINLENLFGLASKAKQKVYEGWIQRYVSEILLNMPGDHFLGAEPRIQEAIRADQRNGMNWHLARDFLSYSDLLTEKGDRQKAQENLGKAIETFKECGADGWVEKAERKLAEMA